MNQKYALVGTVVAIFFECLSVEYNVKIPNVWLFTSNGFSLVD